MQYSSCATRNQKEKTVLPEKVATVARNYLVGVSSDGEGKRIVLEPDADEGYDLSTLDHTDQVVTLCRHIPDTDNYSSNIRVPITFKARDICFHNTSAILYNIDKLKRIATDKNVSATLVSAY